MALAVGADSRNAVSSQKNTRFREGWCGTPASSTEGAKHPRSAKQGALKTDADSFGTSFLEGRTALGVFVASRVLLAAGIGLLVIFAIRSAISFTTPPPPVEHYEGVAMENTDPGNQFLFNGGLMELDVGESDMEVDDLITELTQDCETASLDVKQSDEGAIISCRPKMTTMDTTHEELLRELPSVAWVQKGVNGKNNYMKLSPKEHISIDSLVPGEGDAPGFDIEHLRRFPGMDRWMSFSDPSGNYRSVFYGRGSGTPQSTLLWLQAALADSGWTIVEKELAGDGAHVFATGHGQLIMIRLSPGCSEVCASIMATVL